MAISIWCACLSLCDDQGTIVRARDGVMELTGLPAADVVLGLIDLATPRLEPAILLGFPTDDVIHIVDFAAYLPTSPVRSQQEKKRNRVNQERFRTKITKLTTDIPKRVVNEVEEIYALYPRRCGHGLAVAKIHQALKKVGSVALRAAVMEFAKAVSLWPEDRKQYIPMPATWFNQERWNDDRGEWAPRMNGHEMPRGKRLALLKEAIAQHGANRDSVNHDPDNVTEGMLDEYNRLRRAYETLRNELLG